MKNKFYIMVGNIGSGKSTYLRDNMATCTVISKDGIRYALGGGQYVFDLNLEPIVHSTSMHLTRELCKKKVKELVLDETNVQKKGRGKFIKIAQENGYEVIAIVLPELSKSLCVDRRLLNPHDQDNRRIWELVWEKFDAKYQYPEMKEGFDDIIQLSPEDVM